MAETDPKTVQDLTAVVRLPASRPPTRGEWGAPVIILNANELDDMSCRIDDLEKNIADLMTQAGVEELEGENKTPAPNKS
ncbi:HSBP1 protein, partial [Nycticryphes semicollaris]|nr:HSBP1 protein [Nycticryphes semicollaris]